MSLSKARQLAQDLGTVGISSGGTSVATTVANINFVGAGNTFAVNGTTVDVSIEGGGGTKAGEAINYPSGTKSPFILNSTHITCLLYTSPSPRDGLLSRMPSSA